MDNTEQINEKRTKVGTGVVRLDRVRDGKIQRRKLKSSRKGYKIKDGRSVRMTPSERRKRYYSSIKAVKKRKAKLRAILRKRKISINRGKRQGLY